TEISNSDGFQFKYLRLDSQSDGSIQAQVIFINKDEEEVVVAESGKGSVEAVFNAVDQFFHQEIILERYHIDAITDGIDAQASVLVAVENKATETI
ncbi:alpha-isopropylmalate synthase regulatory domain-containing protein, partial [Streptococcus suis]